MRPLVIGVFPSKHRLDIRFAIRAARNGLKYKYPLCCIARWVWDNFWREYPNCAVRRGFCESHDKTFVPCKIIHRNSQAYGSKVIELK